MTERFKVKGTRIYDNNESLIIHETCTILNQLYEENLNLKSKIETLRCYNAELKKDNNDCCELLNQLEKDNKLLIATLRQYDGKWLFDGSILSFAEVLNKVNNND